MNRSVSMFFKLAIFISCFYFSNTWASLIYGMNSSGTVLEYNLDTQSFDAQYNTNFWGNSGLAFDSDGLLYGMNSSGTVFGYNLNCIF